MLVLTRLTGESFIIGDDVKVTILGMNGSQVRIGVDAPKEIPINREEIYQKIQTEEKIKKEYERLKDKNTQAVNT